MGGSCAACATPCAGGGVGRAADLAFSSAVEKVVVKPWVVRARRALSLCGWGCRESCRFGIRKRGGEGGGECEGGGGDGGAIREGDEVDNVFGALTLWGADGALAVLSG